MIDPSKNTYNHLRSMHHYFTMKDKFRTQYGNVSRSQFSSQTGYATVTFESSQLRNIPNISAMSKVDINHDIKNKIEQLDECVKKTKLQVFFCILRLIYLCKLQLSLN